MINGGYNYSKCWVTQVLESPWPFSIKYPFIAGVIKIALLADVIALLFFIKRRSHTSLGLLIGYLFAILWLNIGPYLRWYYDEKLLPNFFHLVRDIVPDSERINLLAEKYDIKFSKGFWKTALPTVSFGIFVWSYATLVIPSLGIFGVSDPCYWIGNVVVAWTALLGSIGFWGVITTVCCAKELSKENLCVEPLHPDKRGGLHYVGYFGIETALLFSSGSLFLPMLLQACRPHRIVGYCIYFGLALFSLFILLSFLYPTVIVYRKAKINVDHTMQSLLQRYRELASLIENTLEKENFLPLYFELNRLRSEYNDYVNLQLKIFDVNIFLKLALSTIFPFLIKAILSLLQLRL